MSDKVDNEDKIDELNSIFSELIEDATDLIIDLRNSVRRSLYSGILVLLMGYLIFEEKIPVILSSESDASIWAGVSIIGVVLIAAIFFIDYYRLSSKYSKMFNVVKELELLRR